MLIAAQMSDAMPRFEILPFIMREKRNRVNNAQSPKKAHACSRFVLLCVVIVIEQPVFTALRVGENGAALFYALASSFKLRCVLFNTVDVMYLCPRYSETQCSFRETLAVPLDCLISSRSAVVRCRLGWRRVAWRSAISSRVINHRQLFAESIL